MLLSFLLLRVPFAELRGGAAEARREPLDEALAFAEARGLGDLVDAQIGLQQEAFGLLEAQIVDKLLEADARLPLKAAPEMRRAHEADGRDALEGNRLPEVLADIRRGLPGDALPPLPAFPGREGERLPQPAPERSMRVPSAGGAWSSS